ncbi:DLA class II histocompatibility antigen, DR-1 beta chain [Oryzias melastigma]|uniref:DLA class II histocompatibility antigen, DR-1 beta chain n=1 Tax=Oryzias melastigma TaxID=30732 RepID=A0A834FKJ5_ORYME|nr:DLA class II histocompatibility antigen, DR-1 beta chain [Oryzias melastigma]
MESSSLSLCLLFLTVYSADGFMYYIVRRCEFNSSELNDIEFIDSYIYNRKEYMRFSSSVDKFVGYTEFGVKNAERANKDTSYMGGERANKETYCKHNIDLDYQTALSKSVSPSVKVHSVTPSGGHHPSMLVCSVYDFYPKYIKVTWLRDQKEVSSDVTSTAEMEDGDWYYQIHSHLEYTPRSGEKISCKVEHASLKEPLITDWDPSMPESEKNKIAIGASGLSLGLVLSLAGFIYYKRKAQAAEVPVLFLQTDVLNRILKWTLQNLIQNLSVPPVVLVLIKMKMMMMMKEMMKMKVMMMKMMMMMMIMKMNMMMKMMKMMMMKVALLSFTETVQSFTV